MRRAQDMSAGVPSKTFYVHFASSPHWCTIYVCVRALSRPLYADACTNNMLYDQNVIRLEHDLFAHAWRFLFYAINIFYGARPMSTVARERKTTFRNIRRKNLSSI